MAGARPIHYLITLIAGGCLACPALADAGIPAPQLDVNLIFENVESYPAYDFYVRFERKFGPKGTTLEKVEPGRPTHLGGRRSALGPVFLIAVPRGEPAQKGPAAGQLQSQALTADAGGAPLTDYSGYDITYRVHLDGDQLEATWVATNLNQWWSNARLIAILIGAACLLIPLTLVALVVFLIVRPSKKPAAAGDNAG